MEIDVSVIIPSYNRYPQNLLTLYSLQNQSFDPSKMEVIFIDDGSTDETPCILNQFTPPFLFKYLRNDKNFGRSISRNIGIESSLGKIIILLDAEMIVDPDFVQNHYNHHQTEENQVVLGTFYYKSVYTCIFPEFDPVTKLKIENILKDKNLNLSSKELQLNKGNIVQLLSQQDIQAQKYQLLAHEAPYFPQILKHFGEQLSGYHLPWTTFLSGFVSIPRSLLDKIGGFEESFKGWGFEDTELGYRLYLAGAKFRYYPNVSAYHQEHPINYVNIYHDLMKNFYRYQEKYNTFEISVHILVLLEEIDMIEENLVVRQHKQLTQDYPDDFAHFKNGFHMILQKIAFLCSKDKTISNLLYELNLKDPKQWKQKLLSERDHINSLGHYQNFIKAFNTIEHLL
ncbi:glycosyltransferase family 2 protein [Terrilactibacillus laevilacticus]|uniref:Glycosyltransferase family 2 protein n=1 Tax=Terrilactibacillus laevilacticus TaxID=1380157 RepID=A0ABW5PN43_9BACI|nr:glycosyltransferase family 2 protein [Terrilactibacillus laevilacticus]